MSVLPRRLFGLGSLSLVAAGLAACSSSDSETASGQSPTASSGAGEGAPGSGVLFEVTSTTATTADVTMTSVDVNGAPLEQTFNNRELPFSDTLDLDPTREIDVTMLSLTAQIKNGSDVTVSMTINGGTPITSSAEGENATATVFGKSA